MIVNKIENKLKNSNNNVFPLTPTHRKELRQLRNTQLSTLRNKARLIKIQKKEEFYLIYEKKIKKSIDIEIDKCKKLNDNWKIVVKDIKIALENHIKLEKKLKPINASVYNDYNDICNLAINSQFKREWSINIGNVSRTISSDMFKKKFGKGFEETNKRIDDINTAYEEAINFGDLEVVKKLYYMFKEADNFLEQIKNMEIK